MSHDNPMRAEREARLVRIDGEAAEIAYDPDGAVWYVRASSVPGLSASADSEDELVAMLPHLLREARLP